MDARRLNARVIGVVMIAVAVCPAYFAQTSVAGVDVAAKAGDAVATHRIELNLEPQGLNSGRSAVWVFAKYAHPDGGWRDVRFAAGRHSCADGIGNNVNVLVDKTAPRNGVLLAQHSHDARTLTAQLTWDLEASMLLWPESGRDLRVFTVDMVEIPDGGYEVSSSAEATSPLRSVAGSELRIASEGALGIGSGGGEKAEGNYAASDYGGDGQGPVPAAFPKGVGRFYVMRRELTEGEYAGFLSTLDGRARASRDITLHPRYRDGGGSIRVLPDSVEADAPDRPANFVTWADGIAWAAWAGLRPMSELEFEKIVSDNDCFDVEAMLGGRWERAVTIGTPEGRAFRGSEGPGFLDSLGQPYVFTNWDWPGPRAMGSGFRGGFGDDVLVSPGDRTYAAYDATYGNEHEGFRAVRGARTLSAVSNDTTKADE